MNIKRYKMGLDGFDRLSKAEKQQLAREVTREQYKQAHAYIRGADVEYPGEAALFAVHYAHGPYRDNCGFSYTIDPGWHNRTRRQQWAHRKFALALFADIFAE